MNINHPAKRIEGMTIPLRGTVLDPPGAEGSSGGVPIWIATDAALHIKAIKLSCNADPDTELTLALKYADAPIGLAGSALIAQCDTTAGVFSSTIDVAVAAGKFIYFEFEAAPDAALLWFAFDIQYTYD